jgi:hypothetical protein
MGFSGVFDELAPVMETIFVDANYFLSDTGDAKNDAAINRLLKFSRQRAGR